MLMIIPTDLALRVILVANDIPASLIGRGYKHTKLCSLSVECIIELEHPTPNRRKRGERERGGGRVK